jgi:hypothetical protein
MLVVLDSYGSVVSSPDVDIRNRIIRIPLFIYAAFVILLAFGQWGILPLALFLVH